MASRDATTESSSSLPTDAEAIDGFLAAQAPHWLKGATPAVLEQLRGALIRHCALKSQVAQLLAGIQPLDAFAGSLLRQGLSLLGVTVDPMRAKWREYRVRVGALAHAALGTSPLALRLYYEDSNLLQRALQNFTSAQTDANGQLSGTGIYLYEQAAAIAPQQFAGLCRSLDLGGQYQRHLAQVFERFVSPTGQTALQLLTADLGSQLEVQARLELLAGRIDEKCHRALMQAVAGRSALSYDDHLVRVCALSLFERPLQGALVFEVFEVFLRQYRVRHLLVYLPDDSHPLREYSSWENFAQALERDLRAPGYQSEFLTHFTQEDRLALLLTLAPLLNQGQLTLKLGHELLDGPPCLALARQRIARIHTEAAALAVPTEDTDIGIYRQRMAAYESAGLSVAMLVASFVPGLSEIVLAVSLVQLLGECYEGVQDWSHGQRKEALEHLLGVAQSVALGAALGGAAQVISKQFGRSAFVDGLLPVLLDDGRQRLWRADVAAYASPPLTASPSLSDIGLVQGGGRQWLPQGSLHFEVEQSPSTEHWQLCHPRRPLAYKPRLEHNGAGAWRLPGEHPLLWQGSALLLRRFGLLATGLADADCEQVMQICGLDEATLRRLLVENRPLPATVRDVLEQLQLDRRGAGARAPVTPPAGAQVQCLQRDFPGLPQAYAQELVEQTEVDALQFIDREQRLPLAVAERARWKLREARLVRALLGLKLRHVFYEDGGRLALALLRRMPAWPLGLCLELREGSAFGRLIERQLPLAETQQVRVLVRDAMGVQVYTEDGYLLNDELPATAGFFQALHACLEPAQCVRLGWAAEDGAQGMQQSLLAQALAQRGQCGQLIGLTPVSPLLNPWHHLADGRRGYPLSGRGAQGRVSLVSSVRSLFPSLDGPQVERFLAELRAGEGNVARGLLGFQQQKRDLDIALNRWINGASATTSTARRRFADALRRCWRREGDVLRSANGWELGYPLRFNNTPLNDLPVLPAHVSFRHVVSLDLAGTWLSLNCSDFLQAFDGLRQLNLSRCQLSDIPAALANMQQLRELYLNGNQIRLSEAGAARLAGLGRLHVLNLNHNPLGTRLDLRSLAALREVMLRNTQLNTLPLELLEHTALTLVDLRNNAIRELPAAFFDAPHSRQAVVALHDNPLTAHTLVRLDRQGLGISPTPHVAPNQGLRLWLGAVPVTAQTERSELWGHLAAQPGAEQLFQLLADLGTTADYQRAREHLAMRVWSMIEAAQENAALRTELFELAAQPTTCADSVISTFSSLEVRLGLYQALARATREEPQPVLLQFARQLFRLEQVERFAGGEISRRRSAGLAVDEIELNLAYRLGLARTLNLPGQPANMRYAHLAQLTPAQLAEAAAAVRQSEASPALAQFVATRQFWREHLRQVQGSRFELLEQRFWVRFEHVEQQRSGWPEAHYLERLRQLAQEREAALDALALELTETLLQADRGG